MLRTTFALFCLFFVAHGSQTTIGNADVVFTLARSFQGEREIQAVAILRPSDTFVDPIQERIDFEFYAFDKNNRFPLESEWSRRSWIDFLTQQRARDPAFFVDRNRDVSSLDLQIYPHAPHGPLLYLTLCNLVRGRSWELCEPADRDVACPECDYGVWKNFASFFFAMAEASLERTTPLRFADYAPCLVWDFCSQAIERGYLFVSDFAQFLHLSYFDRLVPLRGKIQALLVAQLSLDCRLDEVVVEGDRLLEYVYCSLVVPLSSPSPKDPETGFQVDLPPPAKLLLDVSFVRTLTLAPGMHLDLRDVPPME